MDKEQWIYFTHCEEIECPYLSTDGCHLVRDPQDCLPERCVACDDLTGNPSDSDKSLYIDNDLGPFCLDCYWEEYVD